MKSVKINRVELLGIVRQNKENHVKAFNESVEDYKVLVLKITKENLRLAKTANLDELSKIQGLPQRPVSYEESYSRCIRMLELSVDEIIELDEPSFNEIVLDEWGWKRSFAAAGMAYKTAVSL